MRFKGQSQGVPHFRAVSGKFDRLLQRLKPLANAIPRRTVLKNGQLARQQKRNRLFFSARLLRQQFVGGNGGVGIGEALCKFLCIVRLGVWRRAVNHHQNPGNSQIPRCFDVFR